MGRGGKVGEGWPWGGGGGLDRSEGGTPGVRGRGYQSFPPSPEARPWPGISEPVLCQFLDTEDYFAVQNRDSIN
jgi:hypothetical protein